MAITTEKFGGWDPNGVRKPPLKIWENMGKLGKIMEDNEENMTTWQGT